MIKNLYLYIFIELIEGFLIGLLITTFVLFLDKMLYLAELILNKGISPLDILKILIYITPAFLVITIPISILLASLLTFNRFSFDGELTAMKASGVSLFQMLYPVMVLSIVCYGITNFFMFVALPWGNSSYKNLIYEIAQSKAVVDVKERIFNDDFKGLTLYVSEIKASDNRWEHIFISMEKEGEVPGIIFANKGFIVPDEANKRTLLHLEDAIRVVETSKDASSYRIEKIQTLDQSLDFKEIISRKSPVFKGNRDLSLGELRKKIRRLKKSGENYYSELVELHKKFSIPFACLVLPFIGVPLGARSVRSGKSGGIVLSILIVLYYYITLTAGEGLGDEGKIPPWIAMWFPNISTLVAGIYLIAVTSRDHSHVFLTKAGHTFARVLNFLRET